MSSGNIHNPWASRVTWLQDAGRKGQVNQPEVLKRCTYWDLHMDLHPLLVCSYFLAGSLVTPSSRHGQVQHPMGRGESTPEAASPRDAVPAHAWQSYMDAATCRW